MSSSRPVVPLSIRARSFASLGALNGLLAVALAAAGAHALAPHLVARGDTWFSLASHYHIVHALALFAVAWLCDRLPDSRLAPLAGICFCIGIVLFSGALYGRALGAEGWFVHLVPYGGSVWLLGWLMLGLASWR